MKKVTLALSLLLLSILACRPNVFGPMPTPTSTPRSVVSVDQLQFQDADTGRRFRALDSCIAEMVDDSWNSTSYRLLGNFYSSSWCRGAGASQDCRTGSATQDNRDQQAVELYTLFYAQQYPQVFGLGFSSHWVPATTGWGAAFYFAEQGSTVVGEGWGITFSDYEDASSPAASTVSLGWNTSYTIYGPNRTTFEIPSDLPLREDLAIYLSGPDAMLERGLAQLEALDDKVTAAIQAGEVQGCDLGPYQGDGIPPACTLRPLTEEERSAELARAQSYFSEQEALLNDHYADMYDAWMMSFPFAECWED